MKYRNSEGNPPPLLSSSLLNNFNFCKYTVYNWKLVNDFLLNIISYLFVFIYLFIYLFIYFFFFKK